jgi:predicted porin
MKQFGRMAVLAAAVVLARGACAQSAVQVYGVLDVWAGRSETSAGGPATTMVGNGGMQTSFWGVGGSEDLGGMKAIFAVEGYLQVDTGMAARTPTDALFSRNAFVGLQGAAGEIRVGRILNPLFVATAQTNPFGGSIRLAPLLAQIWSVPMGRAVAGDTSWDNVVAYTTPSLGGMKATVMAGLGETRAGTSTNNLNATLAYGAGPVAATVSVQRVRVGPGLPDIGRSAQTTYFAGGSYDLGATKLYASWDRADGSAPDVAATTWQAGVAVPAGRGNFLASWARTSVRSTAGAAGAPAARRDTGAAGYDFLLSRRTDLYAVAQTDRLAGANRARTYAVGIRHRF